MRPVCEVQDYEDGKRRRPWPSGIETAKKYGLKVILGNGAAGEISCYHEALVSSKMITRAGEMNGFLKQKESILTEGLKTQGGKIILEPKFFLKLDPQKIDQFATDRLSLRMKNCRTSMAGLYLADQDALPL